MEKRSVRVAAVQISPVLDRPGGTLEKVLQAIGEAAGRGVSFAVFPETCHPVLPLFLVRRNRRSPRVRRICASTTRRSWCRDR